MPTTRPSRLFARPSWPEAGRVAEILRRETVGGVLLLIAALAALVWSNSPWSQSYFDLRDATFGPVALHLDLTVGEWAGDGLLAVFFFVAGLELKREFVAGELRDPRRAVLPVGAALGGVVVPAAIYLAITLPAGGDAAQGWAIPTATDIAFALAVLAVIGTYLPIALRIFLLTLAVVDDLVAIVIIALLFTDSLDAGFLALALVPLAAFGVLVQRHVRSPWLLLPLAAATWALVHASGVHATVAGVLLGFTVPVLARRSGEGDEQDGLAEQFERRVRPVSAGIAVPLFALFSAGVAIGAPSVFLDTLQEPIALGIVAGLVLGKPLGILLTTFALVKGTRARLDPSLEWLDVAGVAILGGIGFTVSLLVSELAFGTDAAAQEHAKLAVLCGSLLSAVLAGAFLRHRNRRYRLLREQETRDDDGDGVPDVYERAEFD